MLLPSQKPSFQQPSQLDKLRRFFVFLVAGGAFCLTLASCNPDTKRSESVAIRTAEQNAPLAVLMREMYSDMEEIKVAVVGKEELKSYLKKHEGILTADATDPKVRDSSFQIMAKAYLLHLERLEQSNEKDLLENFQSLQHSCVACHQQKCPGPLKKINALKVN